MSEAPKDPLAFDFGINFESVATRVKGETDERVERSKNELKYNHAFLDDLLRGIAVNDLIVLGAETGAGKTEFARAIAASNAKQGRRVYYFALEAEPKEIERRTKYAIMLGLLEMDRHPRRLPRLVSRTLRRHLRRLQREGGASHRARVQQAPHVLPRQQVRPRGYQASVSGGAERC
jgi:hypothetical protein